MNWYKLFSGASRRKDSIEKTGAFDQAFIDDVVAKAAEEAAIVAELRLKQLFALALTALGVTSEKLTKAEEQETRRAADMLERADEMEQLAISHFRDALNTLFGVILQTDAARHQAREAKERAQALAFSANAMQSAPLEKVAGDSVNVVRFSELVKDILDEFLQDLSTE